MVLVTIFLFITIGLTYGIKEDTQKFSTYKTLDNLFILAVHGYVLRRYLTTTSTFLSIMRQSFYYEWENHRVREVTTFVLLSISFSIGELCNLVIYCSDSINYWCTSFYDNLDYTK